MSTLTLDSLQEKLEEDLKTLRIKNDRMDLSWEKTLALRGRIKEIKDLLSILNEGVLPEKGKTKPVDYNYK